MVSSEMQFRGLNRKSCIKYPDKIIRFSVECAQVLFNSKPTLSDLADIRSSAFRSLLTYVYRPQNIDQLLNVSLKVVVIDRLQYRRIAAFVFFVFRECYQGLPRTHEALKFVEMRAPSGVARECESVFFAVDLCLMPP
jgi:hypothetical protein